MEGLIFGYIDALKIKYFLESHFSQALIFIGFLIDSGLIECLQLNRIFEVCY